MKTRFYNYIAFAVLILAIASCSTREIDELEPARFPTNGDVFVDGFDGASDYSAFGKLTSFEVDMDVAYAGEASMRFEIPDSDDPLGGFTGGQIITSAPRDLTGFNAYTFWARASGPVSVDKIGFGSDDEDQHQLVISGLQLNSNWQKVIIPIPDASPLTREDVLFFFSDGPEEDGKGYTFWVDEAQFEDLGDAINDVQPYILDGQSQVTNANTGDQLPIGGFFATANLPNGVDQRVEVAIGYYDFTSSNTSVATVNAQGLVTVIDSGQAVITATLGTLDAIGSLTIQSEGAPLLPPVSAPTPTASQDSVISMFSNTYNNVLVDTWNPFWEFSTTQNRLLQINGSDDVWRYSMLNFVGILTEAEKIDATEMTHFHIDIWTPDPTDGGQTFKILLVDTGADGNVGGDDDSSHEITITAPTLQTENWVSIDVPLAAFTGLRNRNSIAQLVLSGELPNLFIDNVYYYIGGEEETPEPMIAAPTPPNREAEDVISLFSDAYNDISVDTWRTDWSEASFEDVLIDGNPTKKYSALNFVGITTENTPVDASAMTHLHMDVWSGDFTQFSIKLVDFGANGVFDGGGDDVEHQIDFPAPPQGEWISYDIPLSDFTNLTTRGSLAQYILVGLPSGVNTVFVDNFYFYSDDDGGNTGGGGETEPTVAAPAPTQNAEDVISLFSNAYSDVTVDTWRTDWSNATFEDVQIAGDDVKKYSALDVVGITTEANQVDASGMTHFHMDVWSSDFTQFSIKLVDFGADGVFDGGAGDDVEHQIDFPGLATGEWVRLDIPLSDFTGLTTSSNIAQYILVGQPSGATTVFVDNMFFYNADGGGSTGGGTEPTVAAPAPTQNAEDVISLFSNAYSDVTVDTWRTDWSNATFEDVQVAGDDVKKYSALDVVGITTEANQVDASGMTHFHMDVWSSDFTQFSIKLVDFGADGVFDGGAGDDVEHQIDFPGLATGEWVRLDIPLSDFTGLTTRSNIAQYILVGMPTAATTVFVDNMFFYNADGGGSTGGEGGPQITAPTPTRDSENVISLFSDAYDDVTVDTWRTDWSNATFEDVLVDGNAVKKYSALDVVGITTEANQVDASGMTHLHVDVWSSDFTQFSIKLVDFGADGVFDGGAGDDVEHQIDFPGLATGEWVRLEIPLSDFTGLTTRSNLAQYILVGQPTSSTTIFVDNIYFYK
ncbi:MAG: Ig-like domain-containing protein [Bacteroidota bacterium]